MSEVYKLTREDLEAAFDCLDEIYAEFELYDVRHKVGGSSVYLKKHLHIPIIKLDEEVYYVAGAFPGNWDLFEYPTAELPDGAIHWVDWIGIEGNWFAAFTDLFLAEKYCKDNGIRYS